MTFRTLARQTLPVALFAASALVAVPACAQSIQFQGPSYAGASIGSTDYGTGLKIYLGGKLSPVFGWEGQLTSFGSETDRFGVKRSASAIGGSGTARFPLSNVLTAFGKAGLHYVMPKRSGGDPGNSIELGLGAGLLWNFSHTAALRLELESIGGGDGDMASIGLQFSF